MVSGMKKSDEAVLPVKAVTKGAQVPAEPPEGKGLNQGESSTPRTQGRDGVSQAVERIRQAATRKPQEKLTALLHHITTDALRCAFYDLQKTASAGVDGLDVHRVLSDRPRQPRSRGRGGERGPVRELSTVLRDNGMARGCRTPGREAGVGPRTRPCGRRVLDRQVDTAGQFRSPTQCGHRRLRGESPPASRHRKQIQPSGA